MMALQSPIGSHGTGIDTYIWLNFMVYVGKYSIHVIHVIHGSMGMVYLPKWMVDFYGFHVGRYTIHRCFGYDDSSMYKSYTVRFYQQSQ